MKEKWESADTRTGQRTRRDSVRTREIRLSRFFSRRNLAVISSRAPFDRFVITRLVSHFPMISRCERVWRFPNDFQLVFFPIILANLRTNYTSMGLWWIGGTGIIPGSLTGQSREIVCKWRDRPIFRALTSIPGYIQAGKIRHLHSINNPIS